MTDSTIHVYHHYAAPERLRRLLTGVWNLWCYVGLFFLGCGILFVTGSMLIEQFWLSLVLLGGAYTYYRLRKWSRTA